MLMAAAFSAGAGAPAVRPLPRPISGFPSRLSLSSSPLLPATPHCRSQPAALCAKNSNFDPRTSSSSDEDSGATRRREALFQILFSALSLPPIVASASAETDLQNFRTYEDATNKFRILVPQDWQSGTGDTNSFKSVTAFYPDEVSDTNVSVVITGVGPDFTRLESFGNVDAFAERLVNGLDRSWQRPPGLAAKLIDSKAANGFYYLEYTLQNPGESRRHIISAVGMAFNGWYNRLYTVTGQVVKLASSVLTHYSPTYLNTARGKLIYYESISCKGFNNLLQFIEDNPGEKYRSQIEKSVSSFRFT